MYPTPLARRARPPALAGEINAALGEEGEFFIHDVRLSHLPLPANRPVKELRVFQILPKTPPHTANQPRIVTPTRERADAARHGAGGGGRLGLLSCAVAQALYFQLVDDQGRAVQSMRSATYLQPGSGGVASVAMKAPAWRRHPPGRWPHAARRRDCWPDPTAASR